MHNTGWFGVVRGHPNSSAMSPFDKARTTSCSSLIETMHLSCAVHTVLHIVLFSGIKNLHELGKSWLYCRNLFGCSYEIFV